MTDSDDGWEGPNYAEMAGMAPFDKPPDEYSYIERRAEIYGMIEDAGHPRNLERSQMELADRYDVSQPMISKDIRNLWDFESTHNGQRAKAVTGWLAEKVVMKHIEAAKELEEAGRVEEAADRFEKAMNAQLEYDEYLIDMGVLEQAADELRIEGDAGQAYMAMLAEAHEEDSSRRAES